MTLSVAVSKLRFENAKILEFEDDSPGWALWRINFSSDKAD
jgi:hypothetical protein